MKTSILTFNEIPAIHQWKEAKNFLKYPHRHLFKIYCMKEVSHENRDIEIIEMQSKINDYFNENYKKYDKGNLNFKDESCETIARKLLNYFDFDKVIVLEDGISGAKVEKI